MNAVDTSVIVVNYNGRRWLGRCLAALGAQGNNGDTADVNFEIVVVDNGSTDGSRKFVERDLPHVQLIQLEHNLGFAAASNVGCRVSRGRYLALLNNDTEPRPGWLRALRRALEGNPWAGMATSRVVFMHDPSILDSAGDGLTRAGGAFKHGHGQPVTEGDESREVFGACGAACMIRRDVFEDVGGFDEDFFMVHEDVDFSYRARLRGHRCVYVADAVVAHAGSGTLGRVSPQAVFLGQRNLEWLYLKNTPWPLLLRSWPGHLLYDAAGAAYFAGNGRLRPFMAAKWAALKSLPQVWRKRREVQRRRTASARHVWRSMERGWVTLKLREKRFDRSVARLR